MNPSVKPRIAISACLLGDPVRYDGGHKRECWLVEQLGPFVEWLSFCPEMEMGLGTPRPTLHLATQTSDPAAGGVRLIQTSTGSDFTDAASAASARIFAKLDLTPGCDAFILKSRSPSCGLSVESVPEKSLVPGVFAGRVAGRFPGALVLDEVALKAPVRRHLFLEALFTLARFKTIPEAPGALQEFHGAHKLLLMAQSPSETARLGGIAAGAGEGVRARYFEALHELLQATNESGEDAGRWRNAMEHGIGYLRGKVAAARLDLLRTRIEAFSKDPAGGGTRWSALELMRELAEEASVDYLRKQLLLAPYPAALRPVEQEL